MRSLEAGTYYLKVYNPGALNGQPQLSSIPLSLEFGLPFSGESRPGYGQPDRDKLHGGDGDDTLIGNADIDRLFGDSGTDNYVADGFEIHVQSNTAAEIKVPPTSGDSVNSLSVFPVDPTLNDALFAILPRALMCSIPRWSSRSPRK